VHSRQCCRGSIWQCWGSAREREEAVLGNVSGATQPPTPQTPPLRQALANPTRTAVLGHRGAVARVVGARERPDEMRGGCIRATCARRRAATVPAGGADAGLAPEWTRSRDGVVPGASSRSLARGHAQSRHRFCGTTFSPRAPRDISQIMKCCVSTVRELPACRRRDRRGRSSCGPPTERQCGFSSPHEAVLRLPPRQCRTLPRGAARQCFRQ
jgi:hypothetical protein